MYVWTGMSKSHLRCRHFSVTGRFERLKEVAFEYAYLLKCNSLPEAPLKGVTQAA